MQSVHAPHAVRTAAILALPSLRRCSRAAVTALCWATLIKAGLLTGAALSVAARLVQG